MKIVQLTHMTQPQSMGYVIVAKSGEVLAVDGGHNGSGAELKRVLRQFGGHVDLWLLTHPHQDHFNGVIELLTDPGEITYDRFGASVLPDEWADLVAENEPDYQNLHRWNAFARTMDERLFEIRAGMSFQLGTMKVEILSEANPDLTVNPFNNQSCAIRVTEDGFTMLFLGDLGAEAGERLMQSGCDLKADAVQMAHHGQQGVTEAFYRAVAPKFAFWPTPKWLWDNVRYIGGPAGEGPFRTPEVIGWMAKLGAKNITCFDHTVLFDSETGESADF